MFIPNNEDYTIIEVDTGNVCNLKCPDCNRQDKEFKPLLKEKHFLGVKDFKLMIQKFPNVKRFFLGLMFDEPTLNPNILDIVKFLKQSNLAITFNTNGNFKDYTLWTEILEQLQSEDRIVWSLDGLSNETYQEHRRNGNFFTIKDAIHFTTNYKSNLKNRPTNVIQIIRFKHNEEELNQHLDNFKRYHNILWNKPVWDIIESNGQCTIPTNKVQPTWDTKVQARLKRTQSLYLETPMWKKCTQTTNPKVKVLTLFVSHTGVIGFCLPNLIDNLKSDNLITPIPLILPTLNITYSIEAINTGIKEFHSYNKPASNKTCLFYCGKKSMLAKKAANLDYDIT